MAAGKYDIVIDQGSDFAIEVQIQQNSANVNLSTHSARAQLRPTPTSSTKTADFTCSITNASQGKIKMSLGNSVTANISNGKYYYDLELVNSSDSSVTRLIEGVARVTPEVTR
jgi:hypothetical protein|tara:strand:+ start:149 stop:487 length:339 start_codon:yes stop_codon:yes gene_type:complete